MTDRPVPPSPAHVDAVIRLMAAGLRSTAVGATGLSDLTSDDWAAIHAIAHAQGIEALCFAALPEQAADAMAPDVFARWRHESDLTLYRQLAYDAERESFLAAFADAGLSWLTLKGIDIVTYYPQPGLRSMGDQDLVVAFVADGKADESRTAQAESIMTCVMAERGYAVDKESDRELGFVKDDLHIECHRAMMSDGERANGFYGREVLDHYRNPWALAIPSDAADGGTPDVGAPDAGALDDGAPDAGMSGHAADDTAARRGRGYRLPADEEYLFHVAHMWKHYNCTGFGLRFLADTLVLREHHRKRIDWTAMASTVESMGMGEFEATVWALSETLLRHPDDWADRLGERERAMLAEIMGGGTYGRSDLLLVKQVQRRMAQASARAGDGAAGAAGTGLTGNTGRAGRARVLADYWMRRVMPDRETARIYYPKLAALPAWPLFVTAVRAGRALAHPGRTMREIRQTLRRVGREGSGE